MTQVFVVRMRKIDEIAVRFHMKNCQFVSLCYIWFTTCWTLKSVRVATRHDKNSVTCYCISKKQVFNQLLYYYCNASIFINTFGATCFSGRSTFYNLDFSPEDNKRKKKFPFFAL